MRFLFVVHSDNLTDVPQVDVLKIIVKRMGVFPLSSPTASSVSPLRTTLPLSFDVIVPDMREYRLFLGESRAFVSFTGCFSSQNAF